MNNLDNIIEIFIVNNEKFANIFHIINNDRKK